MKTRKLELDYDMNILDGCQSTYTVYYLDNQDDLAEFIKSTFDMRYTGATLNDIPLKKKFIYYQYDCGDYRDNVITLVEDLIKELEEEKLNIAFYICKLKSNYE